MWELNDANITNTYETSGFCMPDDYVQSAQWDFDAGYANHSENEIDLATVLMNLKEEYPEHSSCSTDHHHHHHNHLHHHQRHDVIGNGYHTTIAAAAANCNDDERQQHQHQQQHHHHHHQQQQQQQQQQQHHHHHHHQHDQPQWQSVQPDEHRAPLQRDDFVQYDSLDGSTNNNYVHSSTDDPYLLPAVLDVDEEYCKVNTLIEKKRAGRPRGVKVKRSKAEPKLSRIWEFIRDLLLDSQYCPTYICWENYEEGRFRFVQSDKVAKLWGKFKRNDRMNYEKFSRAMRYYYKTGVLLPVQGKRLVYKFGPKATGWHTDNPNFKYTF